MTYASKLRAKLDPNHTYNQSFGQRKVLLPEEYYEEIYQRTLKGGYDKRNVRCETCFVLKSITGSCNCE
jgi:hypothetical protein